MTRPNRNIELSVEDMELIEAALRAQTHAVIGEGCDDAGSDVSEIQDLLGRLHNQKVFYRPSSGPYIGG